MNIIISGWPATGSTTLALLLAYLLDYKYMYGGGVMKYLAEKTVGETSGPKFIEFEKHFGPYFDAIWERYAIWKLSKVDNLILDGKAGGFFVEDENVFEVMLIANTEVRKQRAEKDKRIQAEQTIAYRDQNLQTRWQSTYGIDIFNANQLQDNYDLIIDNTALSITQELERLLTYLEEDFRFPDSDLGELKYKINSLAADYANKGKEHILQRLESKGKLIDNNQIFADWRREFPELVNQMPEEVRNYVTE